MTLPDRILGPLKRLVREWLSPDTSDPIPAWAYLVPWRYTVSEASETSFSGRALSSRCPHPDLPAIPLMPGVAGTGIKPAVGSVALVAFADGDPAQPFVVGWDQAFAQHVQLQSAATGDAATALTVDIAPAGLQVYDLANVPPAQAVALAPAVTSFASASTTLASAGQVLEVAVGVFATAVGVATPAVAGAAATLVTAVGVYTAAVTTYTGAVGALIGSFPTGFTATKTKTQ